MKRKLVFWTAFNSYRSSKLLRNKPASAAHPVTTQEWTNRRAELFVKYTLPSILNQTYEDFFYVVLLDPNLRHLTELLFPEVDDRVIYCYEDAQALDLIRDYDEVVMALIDSDDMYSRWAGELMMACPAEWMYFRRGYAYEERRGRLWHYDTIGVGPFFARRVHPADIAVFDRDKRHPTHKDVIRMRPHRLADGNFCVVLHGANTSSTPTMRYVLKRPAERTVLFERFAFGHKTGGSDEYRLL